MNTNTIWHASHGALTALGGFLGWWFGGWDALLYVLVAFAAADYVTGVMCAVVRKQLSSEVGFKGIAKKVMIFTLIGVAHMLDTLLGDGTLFRTALLFWYIANEGLSLVENAAILGVPVPDLVKDALAQIKNKGEKNK